jgi:hypothetical protein
MSAFPYLRTYEGMLRGEGGSFKTIALILTNTQTFSSQNDNAKR